MKTPSTAKTVREQTARRHRRSLAREAIQQQLQSAALLGEHLTAEDLYRRLSAASVPLSLATVYRTLHLFEDEGLVTSHSFEGLRRIHEWADQLPHDHIVNLDTGEIRDYRDSALEQHCTKLADQLGLSIAHHRLTLYVRQSS